MDPYQRLRILLRLERQRGAAFDDAWQRSTTRVASMQANPARWLEVLDWSRAAWCRAYEMRPKACMDWLELPAGEHHDTHSERGTLIA